MPRGGKRQGTPGKGYANRTDLMMQPDMEKNTAAAGGMEAPAGGGMMLPTSPDQLPSLTTPTQRPDEPLTDGLAVGAGRGREALTNYDPRRIEAQALKRWLPIMEPVMNDPETPDSVRTLLQYIRGV